MNAAENITHIRVQIYLHNKYLKMHVKWEVIMKGAAKIF